MLGSSITKNSLLLGIFALATTALLAFTAEFTKARIAKSEREAQQKALFEIVPRARHDNDILSETIEVPADAWAGLGLKSADEIHVARHADNTVAVIIPAIAPDGYSGDIRMIVGINADGTIAGVRILDHHETPGLGDKIELKKAQWILDFNGKSLQNPSASQWKVKKDGGTFDQFAGATITPRAVVNQVRKVLEFVDAHRDELFKKNSAMLEAKHE
ncbi:electron transport complex subunit G [Cellvibrio zantedeschiae]|uniref:Ion-translocating oxidoreductase complex subunit G n=1 Tax=Cellvibrio zantedeschiae TaxID=1237077 RepID=A0ABQ3AZI6_9GAMM|nr:electron transport complex subunit RsxG [Cellvibrio zantedeschiae]GGY68877.1 electron transport complex subunit G [Cellvibrio zantedeschiae]